jgi:hypothetical protein
MSKYINIFTIIGRVIFSLFLLLLVISIDPLEKNPGLVITGIHALFVIITTFFLSRIKHSLFNRVLSVIGIFGSIFLLFITLSFIIYILGFNKPT